MGYFLGVDAGGTKADLALADEEKVLARVRTGTIKRMRTDAATATRNLEEGLRQLEDASGISMRSVERTCIGTAGESVPMVRDWLQGAFAARVGGELLVLGDVEIALDAAFPGESGVLVLAGTGSNVAGRTDSGKLITAGGWGPALADQGSGYRIGQEALRAIFASLDEEEPTLLLGAVMDFWGIKSLESLVEFANATPAPDVSKLTELVTRCAEAGDPVAQRVLRDQGAELAHLVTLVMARVQRSSKRASWVPPVAFAGSVMEKVDEVRATLCKVVRRQFPKVRMLEGVVDPVEGALWRARSVKVGAGR